MVVCVSGRHGGLVLESDVRDGDLHVDMVIRNRSAADGNRRSAC